MRCTVRFRRNEATAAMLAVAALVEYEESLEVVSATVNRSDGGVIELSNEGQSLPCRDEESAAGVTVLPRRK